MQLNVVVRRSVCPRRDLKPTLNIFDRLPYFGVISFLEPAG